MAGPLAQRIRAKYPDAYTDLTDEQLEKAVTAKYPGVYDDLMEPSAPSGLSLAGTTAGTFLKDLVVEPVKLAGALASELQRSTVDAGNLVREGKYGEAFGRAASGTPLAVLGRGIIQSHAEEARKAVNAPTWTEAIGHGAAAALPVVGPMAAHIGEQIGSGDPVQQAEALGHSLAFLAGPKAIGSTGTALTKATTGAARTLGGAARGASAGYEAGGVGGAIVKGMEGAWQNARDLSPNTLMIKALKPANTKIGFDKTLDAALPQINRIAKETGTPITDTASFLAATKQAKHAVRAEYDALMGPRRAIGSTVDLTPVAEAMEQSIPLKTRLENPTQAKAITDMANLYRKKFDLEEAETLLRDANAELEGYYNKFPMARSRAAHSNPDIAPTVAQATELRNAIYGALDAPGQPPIARDLQRQYGALMEVENAGHRRMMVAQRQQPESLSEQIGKVRAAGELARGTWKLAHGNLSGAADIAAGMAGRSMATFLKEQQTMDALIKRAMQGYTKVARATPIPASPRIAGLLPEPARPMSAATEPPAKLIRGERGARATTTEPSTTPAVGAGAWVLDRGPMGPDTAEVAARRPAPLATLGHQREPVAPPPAVSEQQRHLNAPRREVKQANIDPRSAFDRPDASPGELRNALITDAVVKQGYKGSLKSLHDLITDAVKDAKALIEDAKVVDDSGDRLLKLIAKNGGIGNLKAGAREGLKGELERLWEHSTGMVVGRGFKKGTHSVRGSRSLSQGAIGGVPGVMNKSGKSLDDMVIALREDKYPGINDINDLLVAIENAHAASLHRQSRGPSLASALQQVGVKPGTKWWEVAEQGFDPTAFEP